MCVLFQATFVSVSSYLLSYSTASFHTYIFSLQHNEDNVIFVVQGNHIFGSLHDPEHGKFTINPCPYNETCHTLMQKMP